MAVALTANSADPRAVDVIVPIHGAHEELKECLSSLFRHTDFSRHQLILVVDGDPGFERSWIDQAGATDDSRCVVLIHDQALGFTSSVNHGMSHSERDVVLLNSDTLVTPGWLEKMARAACSQARVATVTPFSNNATLCSIPEPFVCNSVPSGLTVDQYARAVELAAEPCYPELPTGVGMCLYIRRAALHEVGHFDEATFPRGYGEETDFCLRAAEAGFTNLLDDSTFIFHHGSRSFGSRERQQLEQEAGRIVAERHPGYRKTLVAFMRKDPLAPLRDRVQDRVRRTIRWQLRENQPRRKLRVLHLVHGWPPHSRGGTENYARWLVREQAGHHTPAVYSRLSDPNRKEGSTVEESVSLEDSEMALRLWVNNFTQRNPLVRNALLDSGVDQDFRDFLERFDPDLLHVHHLAGHSMSLLTRAVPASLPVLYQIQDWWSLCARANLYRPETTTAGLLCSGPDPGKCSDCLPLTRLGPGKLSSRQLYRLRQRLARQSLGRADGYVMGSEAIAADYRRAGLLDRDKPLYVLPYGVEAVRSASVVPGREAMRPIRCGYVGALMPHKGVHIAVEAISMLEEGSATLDIWGSSTESDYQALLDRAPAIELRGAFRDEDIDQVYSSMDILLVPSIGLESFGLVAREAMARGVPVVASRAGALVELFERDGAGGTWVAPNDASALAEVLRGIVEDPSLLARWADAIPAVHTVAEHNAAIEQVYLDLIEAHGTEGS